MSSLNLQYYWPAEDTEAVATNQDVEAGGTVIMNGKLMNPYYPNEMSFIAHGFIRNVSLTSPDDLSATKFNVRGTVNGQELVDEIIGPNANTVYGTIAFDNILEIYNNNGVAATNLSVGTGDKGYFISLGVNLGEPVLSAFTSQMILYQVGTAFTYSYYFSADTTALNNKIRYEDLITNGTFLPIDGFQNKTASALLIGIPPLVVSSILVKVTTTDPAVKAKLIFLQL